MAVAVAYFLQWLMDKNIDGALKVSLSVSLSVAMGHPRLSLTISISRKERERPNPVPSALERASFAEKRPAVGMAGSLWRKQYSNSSGVRTLL